MRKLLIAAALLVGVVFIIGKYAEVQAIVETMQRGDWRYIVLAFIVQFFWLLNVALSYRTIYRATGMDERVEQLFMLSSAANFVNVVAPSVGMGGMAVFISEARRRGYSSARVTVAGVLYVLFDYAGFLCILTLGLIVLSRRNNINSGELVASAILVLVASVLATLLFLGLRSAKELGHALAWMVQRVNAILRPFTHREYLSEKRAHEFAQDAADGLREITRQPKNLLAPAALALSNKALLVSILLFMFLAFKVPLSIGTLIAGFSIGYLFVIVSPTPSGIGVVEGVLTLTLVSLNVPLSESAVVTLAYRGITFWLPLLWGMISFRWVSQDPSVKSAI